MDRRQFLVGVTLSAGIAGSTPTLGQPASLEDTELVSSLPPLPSDLATNAEDKPAPYIDTNLVGTAAPTQTEIAMAYDILMASPKGAAPVDVAQYFLAVGAGAYGDSYRPFAREWPIRANPLIYHFFSATQTKPEGDTTAWCAAFVNWCIQRSWAKTDDEIGKAPGAFSQSGKPFADENLRSHGTNSASSGSFRCWTEVASPQRGDIVVFKDAGTDSLTRVCRGTGHVAFYLGVPRPGWVRVLGGNQTLIGSNGAVTVANMRTTAGSRFMKYVSPK